ncbi:hypothetical protein CMUS01_08156 [Colletotrichum musicola]|uniref:Fungal N-terminal domain-containing protein n=1 Tax=Colletotrichum musicola TaxID=2175873 RepID=A0A8H6KEA8_9PEZI|nr:hypothetical protein CMUS01_08156 [Colletotrichum musicola]
MQVDMNSAALKYVGAPETKKKRGLAGLEIRVLLNLVNHFYQRDTPSITRLKLHKLHITQYLAEELTRMADPFSMVSGAVGLVSGGIQICVGVRKYLNAIKDRHKELAAAWDAARALAAVLENLNGVIGRLRDERPVEAALLLQCLEGAQGPLLELRDIVARLEGFPKDGIPSLQSVAGSSLSAAKNGSGDIMRKTKNTGRSMVYRIHQEDIKDLRVALQQLITSLNTAFLTVNLNQNEGLAQNLQTLQNSVLAAASTAHSDFALLASQSKAAADDVQAVVKKNAADLSDLQDSIAHDLSSIKQQLLAADNTGQFVLAELRMINRRLEQQATSATSLNKSKEVAKRVVASLPPASLKLALDAFSDCQCQSRTTGSATSSLGMHNFRVFFQQQTLSRHERDCPLHALTKERRTTVGARARLRMGSFLSGLIEANLWCSTGLGATSFGPSVRWKSFVPWRRSPAQREFSRFRRRLRAGDQSPDAVEVVNQLAKMRKPIFMLYSDGKASVSDIDEDGKNHLQAGLACDEADDHQISVTGWHYLSMRLVSGMWGILGMGRPRMSKATVDLVATIADGDAQHRHDRYKSDPKNAPHPLEYHERLAGQIPVPKWQLELLRLLTFEALEMTHLLHRLSQKV